MAATELQDLSGMEEVYRQQKDKLVFQSVLGINPSTSTQGTQTHIIWKYVESLEWTTHHLTTVKTDLHERVNDSELTKESLKNDKEKMILAFTLKQIYFILHFIRPHLKETMEVIPFILIIIY